MAFLPGYCTVVYADTVNVSAEWVAYTDPEKELAITMGRFYIDKNYTCLDSDDWDRDVVDSVPEEVQLANAKLAEEYALGILIPDFSADVSSPITKKKVKAGSVETDTTYAGYFTSRLKIEYDKKKEITLLLSPYCTFGSTCNLIRV